MSDGKFLEFIENNYQAMNTVGSYHEALQAISVYSGLLISYMSIIRRNFDENSRQKFDEDIRNVVSVNCRIGLLMQQEGCFDALKSMSNKINEATTKRARQMNELTSSDIIKNDIAKELSKVVSTDQSPEN